MHGCFATRWAEYGYGLTLRAEDACTKHAITTAFKPSGYNVKQLLIELTQTDARAHPSDRHRVSWARDAFHYITVAHQE
ncbi:DUF1585 domain-containing protein [Sorangium sp. So ce1099]|uniref:DUF1585 domain-containing protein n=1 Tax=Sorangium sp. So ce1099 TaxID=3133331 RepID=UPI003F5FF068